MLDIRKIALEVELTRQPLWVDRWGAWVMVQELTGEERANLLESCTTIVKTGNKREGKVNLKKLYPMLAILSLRYPESDVLPDSSDPHYSQYPGVNGNPTDERAGQLIFSPDDLIALNKRSGAILELVSKPASILSGLREEDIEEKKEDSEETKQADIVDSTGYVIA